MLQNGRDHHLGWRLQVDPQVQPSIEAPGLPPEAALMHVLTLRLGTDAVEALALDVELPCGGGDLVVEQTKPAEGLGVGELEVPVGAPAALDLFELAAGLGSWASSRARSGRARASKRSRSGPSRSAAFAAR